MQPAATPQHGRGTTKQSFAYCYGCGIPGLSPTFDFRSTRKDKKNTDVMITLGLSRPDRQGDWVVGWLGGGGVAGCLGEWLRSRGMIGRMTVRSTRPRGMIGMMRVRSTRPRAWAAGMIVNDPPAAA